MKNAIATEFTKNLSLFRAVAYRAAGVTGTIVDDIIQDSMVKLMGADFNPERGSFRAFACSVVANTAKNALRNAHASQYVASSTDDDGNTVEVIASVVGEDGRTVVESKEAISVMHAAIAALPDDDCTFILAIMDDFTDKDAGALVGWTPVQALRAKRRILASLREVLSA